MLADAAKRGKTGHTCLGKGVNMPELTVRSFAELVHLPAYEQSRILYEQKYPRQAPQTFKSPYYAVALGEFGRAMHQEIRGAL
jgi:hypothetical protein